MKRHASIFVISMLGAMGFLSCGDAQASTLRLNTDAARRLDIWSQYFSTGGFVHYSDDFTSSHNSFRIETIDLEPNKNYTNIHGTLSSGTFVPVGSQFIFESATHQIQLEQFSLVTDGDSNITSFTFEFFLGSAFDAFIYSTDGTTESFSGQYEYQSFGGSSADPPVFQIFAAGAFGRPVGSLELVTIAASTGGVGGAGTGDTNGAGPAVVPITQSSILLLSAVAALLGLHGQCVRRQMT